MRKNVRREISRKRGVFRKTFLDCIAKKYPTFGGTRDRTFDVHQLFLWINFIDLFHQYREKKKTERVKKGERKKKQRENSNLSFISLPRDWKRSWRNTRREKTNPSILYSSSITAKTTWHFLSLENSSRVLLMPASQKKKKKSRMRMRLKKIETMISKQK